MRHPLLLPVLLLSALAAASLASKRLGALIVIERDMGLRTFYETGISLDAEVSSLSSVLPPGVAVVGDDEDDYSYGTDDAGGGHHHA